MRSRKPYTAKTLAGAQRRVRELQIRVAEDAKLLEKIARERVILAKLSAKGPVFFDVLEAMDAELIRDEILGAIGMKPDGSPL